MAARPVVSRRPRASRDAFDDALFAAIAESLRSQEKMLI